MVVEQAEHDANMVIEHNAEHVQAETAAKEQQKAAEAEEKQQEATGTKEKFVCPECGKEFRSEMALRGHMSAHRRSRAKNVIVEDEDEDEGEKWIESELIPKKIALRPSILVYYEWAKRHGFEGGLSEFINRCVEDLFERVMGVQLALVEKQVRSVVLSGGGEE